MFWKSFSEFSTCRFSHLTRNESGVCSKCKNFSKILIDLVRYLIQRIFKNKTLPGPLGHHESRMSFSPSICLSLIKLHLVRGFVTYRRKHFISFTDIKSRYSPVLNIRTLLNNQRMINLLTWHDIYSLSIHICT